MSHCILFVTMYFICKMLYYSFIYPIDFLGLYDQAIKRIYVDA